MTKKEIITQIEDLARDAKARIDPEDSEDVFRRDYEALTGAVEILKEARHGKWGRCYEDWRHQIEGDKCSICGFEHYGTSIAHYHYCPNCGAKMDLEE